MKKFFAIAVIAIAFVACNNDAEKKPAEDTTVVAPVEDTTTPAPVQDTTVVAPVEDTTAAPAQ